ncbi:MAG TPA: hypothetical protein DHW07_01160, partial [Gammaproteobacteria bacterium]|nr:hypothetical protein [Gammaproteobacteria bacterium]
LALTLNAIIAPLPDKGPLAGEAPSMLRCNLHRCCTKRIYPQQIAGPYCALHNTRATAATRYSQHRF